MKNLQIARSTTKHFFFAATLVAALFLIACEGTEPTPPDPVVDLVELSDGFFLLNEGSYQGNNSTLDFYGYAADSLIHNIFEARNPDETMGLGDTGNDLQIHNGKLYAVMNGSNYVAVIDARDAKLTGTVAVKNPRYIAFSGGFGYVTSYGDATLSNGAPKGFVAKIDLATLKIAATCEVGHQPDGLVAVGGKLYVANSGGYNAPNYDTAVSVIDLATFTAEDEIEVAPNLRHLIDAAGNNGDNGGNLIAVPWDSTDLYSIDIQDNNATKLPVAGGTVAITDNTLYAFGTAYDASWNPTVFYNTFSGGTVKGSFITDGTESQIVSPYGLAVDQATGNIFVTDAGDYVSDGKLNCYSPAGKLQWSITAGVIPSKIAFWTPEN